MASPPLRGLRISNTPQQPCQLLHRHTRITKPDKACNMPLVEPPASHRHRDNLYFRWVHGRILPQVYHCSIHTKLAHVVPVGSNCGP